MSSACKENPLTGRTVLIVDDDEQMRGLWKHMLSREMPDVRAEDAADGAQAVALAAALRPDLIVMDVAMPTLDGFSATRQLKSERSTARIPVIVVTGTVFSSQAALDAGCDAYLIKPVSQRELLDQVSRLLGRR